MDWTTIGTWLLGILLVGIFLRMVWRAFLLFLDFKKTEEFAGYARGEVAQKRLWASPTYPSRLFRAIRYTYPQNLGERLEYFMRDLEQQVTSVDLPLLYERGEVLDLYAASFESGDLYARNTAVTRLNHLQQVVIHAATKMVRNSPTQRGLLKWHENLHSWAHTAPRMIPELKRRMST